MAVTNQGKTIGADVQEFAENVAAQTRCIEAGDHVRGNRHARRYVAAFERLRKRGDDGRAALTALFDDERPDVRVMAAAYLLRHSEERAIAILSAAAKESGMIAFGAEQALKRWAEGTWALDPL